MPQDEPHFYEFDASEARFWSNLRFGGPGHWVDRQVPPLGGRPGAAGLCYYKGDSGGGQEGRVDLILH